MIAARVGAWLPTQLASIACRGREPDPGLTGRPLTSGCPTSFYTIRVRASSDLDRVLRSSETCRLYVLEIAGVHLIASGLEAGTCSNGTRQMA